MNKVYLAGGFKSDWANKVRKCSDKIHFINPKDKEFKNGERIVMNVDEYGKWDLHYIRKSDILFTFIINQKTLSIQYHPQGL